MRAGERGDTSQVTGAWVLVVADTRLRRRRLHKMVATAAVAIATKPR